MKAKSFTTGLSGGIEHSMGILDKFVADLGDIVINDITDTVYSAQLNHNGHPPKAVIVRVITFIPVK